jgi:hypothetical protein
MKIFIMRYNIYKHFYFWLNNHKLIQKSAKFEDDKL